MCIGCGLACSGQLCCQRRQGDRVSCLTRADALVPQRFVATKAKTGSCRSTELRVSAKKIACGRAHGTGVVGLKASGVCSVLHDRAPCVVIYI